MNPQGGMTGALSPDAVQTEIDAVAWEKYQRKNRPEYLSASDTMFFKQMTDNKLAYTWDEYSNVGPFEKMDEQEEFGNSDAFIGNTKTVKQQKYGKQVPVSKEAFKADQVGLRTKIGADIGDQARKNQDSNTILDTYGDAFAGSVITTPDGDALSSASHTTLKGYNVDNLETAALDADGLWTCVQTLKNQISQDGTAGSYEFEGLLVPFNLYKTAKQVMNSQLIPGSAENDINIFETDYGNVAIKATIFLGSTYNSATNAATSYHVVSSSHMITRNVFSDFEMRLIPPENTANDSYIMRSTFEESHLAESWAGYVGSNGTA